MKKEDILNRKEFVESVIRFIQCLSKNKANSAFAIDGKWGVGKTYVLEMLEENLTVIQSEETADDRYIIFHYNCWEYDYYEEPIMAIIVFVMEQIDNKLKKSELEKMVESGLKLAKEELKKVLGELIKNKVGLDPFELTEELTKEAEKDEKKYQFDESFLFREALKKTKESLTKLAEEKTIVFIVDELDRCLPTYAIKTLERLHHIFEGFSNTTLILAVDKNQLRHSIKTIFGTEDNAVEDYLRKFIDFSFLLEEGNVKGDFRTTYKKYYSKFKEMEECEYSLFQEMYQKMFSGLNMRTQEKLIARAELLHNVICGERQADPALMVFEIYAILFIYMTKSDNLSWLKTVKNMRPKSSIELINEEKMDYLKKIGEVYEAGAGLNDHVMSKFFWLVDSLYDQIRNNQCAEFYFENSNSLTCEVEYVKQFMIIIKNIHWKE